MSFNKEKLLVDISKYFKFTIITYTQYQDDFRS